MKKILCGMLFCIATSFTAKAQIGYQVSLLNTATGEPRTNVTVNAAVTITDSKGGVIYSGSQSATSNDFGVLSLTVGNANTFKNVDFSKLPFFIQVSVDGKMIGPNTQCACGRSGKDFGTNNIRRRNMWNMEHLQRLLGNIKNRRFLFIYNKRRKLE